MWAHSRPRRRIPRVTGPLAYLPDPNEPEVYTKEQLQKFSEPLRGIIEMYQEMYQERSLCDDWGD